VKDNRPLLLFRWFEPKAEAKRPGAIEGADTFAFNRIVSAEFERLAQAAFLKHRIVHENATIGSDPIDSGAVGYFVERKGRDGFGARYGV
jgi:hypothetical protein